MSNRFTLRMDNDDCAYSVEVCFEEEYIGNVLMNMAQFLRGCGFVVGEYDQLEFVSPEPATPGCGDCGGCYPRCDPC